MDKKLSKLGLGTSNIASLGKSLSFKKAKRLFDLALDINISTIDTSDTYGSGDAERLIGKIIKDKRKDIFIISKVGYPYIGLPEFLSPLNQFGKKLLQGLKFKKRFRKKYILSGVEKSLKRLNINYLDAYLLHDLSIYDISIYNDECFEALYMIKKKGLSRFVGISSNDHKAINFVIENINIDLLQTKMVFKKRNESFLDKAKNKGLNIIVNSIFNQNIDNNFNTNIKKLLNDFNIPEKNKNSILITYCLLQKNIDCALFGTTNLEHLNLIGNNYKQYKDNFSELFVKLESMF